ncbi:MAG: DUF5658 family protein [Planctomycetota bacterium]|jgi:hypothetical protein
MATRPQASPSPTTAAAAGATAPRWLGLPDLSRITRDQRMGRLLAAIVLLSLVDAVLTIGFMRTTGMYEANPLVIRLVEWTGSTAVIGLYKAATVGVGVAILYRLRSRLASELAAWFMTAVLVALTCQWVRYTRVVADAPVVWITADADPAGADWVRLG